MANKLYRDMLRLSKAAPPHTVPIAPGVNWPLNRHAIISAMTGYGKSYALLFIAAMLSIAGAVVLVADPKRSDLSALAQYMPEGRVATNSEGISKLLDMALTEMTARYAHMERERERRGLFQADYADFGLGEVAFIMDEQAAHLMLSTKKEREAYEDRYKSYLLQGRQAGCISISAMQQPNAQNCPTESREQYGFKLMLGGGTKVNRAMLFGDGWDYPKRTYVPGQGLYMLDGVTPCPSFIQMPSYPKDQIGEALELALARQRDLPLLSAPDGAA